MLKKLKTILRRNKTADAILTNYSFRTAAFSLGSFAAGVGYAVFNLAVGVIYSSVWYGALACYYIMLGFMRGGVLYARYKCKRQGVLAQNDGYVRQYLVCGILFIVMTVFLAVMVWLIVKRNITFAYSLSVLYMAAGYTFYRMALSVYNFVKSEKLPDYSVRALRCINLATALVSFLSLQSAALSAFSKNIDQIAMNALTGGVVCILIVAMGVFMILSAAIKLKGRRQMCMY